MMESIKKNIVFTVGLVVLGGFGLFWFLRDTGENIPEEGIIEQPSQFAASRAEILGTIATLRAVQLDISFWTTPRFGLLPKRLNRRIHCLR